MRVALPTTVSLCYLWAETDYIMLSTDENKLIFYVKVIQPSITPPSGAELIRLSYLKHWKHNIAVLLELFLVFHRTWPQLTY